MANTQQFGSKGNNNTYTGTTLSSWSRQQKIAMVASFVILGLLLALSACSKASKPAAVKTSSPAPTSATAATAPTTPAVSTPAETTPATPKKVRKVRPATVTYNDSNSGVSFRYPRKYALTAGEKALPAMNGVDPLPMNFVEKGGVAVATVEVPRELYPRTDFASAFFHVNVNRSLTEQQCSQFAFVEKDKTDGQAAEPANVEVGAMKLVKTSDFDNSKLMQADADYYHRYENGVCYEFVLGMGTQGYGTVEGIKPVSREDVFGKLEKILATVTIQPAAQEQVAKVAAAPEASK